MRSAITCLAPLRAAIVTLALLFAPAGAWPQAADPEPPIAGAADIPLEEWTAMALGRTLTYRIGGELWAQERYAPTGNQVSLQFRDGRCVEGTWEYVAPLYCFNWRELGTSCFRHLRQGDTILILEAPGGVENGRIQEMTGVSDMPLACGPAVTS